MPLFTASNLSKLYPTQDVLTNVSVSLNAGERIGLVGANGTGKTTLLRLIAGLDEPTYGTLDRPGSVRIGYLPQDVPELMGTTLHAMMLEVFEPVMAMETELNELTEKMTDPDCPERVLKRYSTLQHEFEVRGGYDYQRRIETVLHGLGFQNEQHQWPLSQFSGGWRTRALLARLLLEEPDLLLMDEPTNSLDLDTVCWLEQFLSNYRGSLLITSHDRFFLNKLCNRIWEVAFCRVETYKGNYTDFRKQRKERLERRQKEWDAQQAYIANEEDFIRKNLAGQRTKEAQGRRTKLARYLEREAVPKPESAKSVSFRFHATRRTGDLVLQSRDLTVGYEADAPLLQVPNLRLERGMKIAIVGPNGTGKTTFLRTLAGELSSLAGEISFGSNVDLGYVAQTHDTLDKSMSLLDNLRQFQSKPDDPAARKILGGLLFSGDMVFNPVGDLSGGQRARLAIAACALREPNLFMLDEPTNHLDIPTMEALQDALNDYNGTLLMVSHDRYLVQEVADQLLILENGTATLIDGTWEDYVARDSTPAPETAKNDESTSTESEKSAGREAYEREKKERNELKRAQKRYSQLETQLHDLEDEKKMLEHAIGKAGEAQDIDEVTSLSAKYDAVSAQIDAVWEEYAELAEIVE